MIVPCMPWNFLRMHTSHENKQIDLVLFSWKMYTLCLLFRSNANSIGLVKGWRDSEISKLHLSAQQNLLNTRLWFCHWHTKRYVEYIALTTYSIPEYIKQLFHLHTITHIRCGDYVCKINIFFCYSEVEFWLRSMLVTAVAWEKWCVWSNKTVDNYHIHIGSDELSQITYWNNSMGQYEKHGIIFCSCNKTTFLVLLWTYAPRGCKHVFGWPEYIKQSIPFAHYNAHSVRRLCL